MFKYIVPIILIKGKSSRLGKNKILLKINGISFLDLLIDLLFSLGFSIFFISGTCYKYRYIIDILEFNGPLGGFYSVFINVSILKFFRILFLPIDMCFLTREILLNLLFNFNIFVGLLYKKNNFPILLAISNNIKKILVKLLNKQIVFISLHILFFYILMKNISIEDKFIYLFKNVNSILELNLYRSF